MRNVKWKLMPLFAVFFALCMTICAIMLSNTIFNTTADAKMASEVSLFLGEGGLRFDNADYGKNVQQQGLNFRMEMSKSDYDGLKAYGYQSLYFGIIIAPADYDEVNPIDDKDNLVGENAVYDWAILNLDGEWEYTGTKTRIVNLYVKDLAFGKDAMYFNGNLLNIAEENIGRNFTAVGYVLADGEYFFTAQKQTACMGYVAQKQVEKLPSNDTFACFLNDNYVSKVLGTDTTYSIKHVKVLDNGEKQVESETKSINAKVGETVEVDPISIAGYSCVGGQTATVYAGGNTVIEVTYVNSAKRFNVNFENLAVKDNSILTPAKTINIKPLQGGATLDLVTDDDNTSLKLTNIGAWEGAEFQVKGLFPETEYRFTLDVKHGSGSKTNYYVHITYLKNNEFYDGEISPGNAMYVCNLGTEGTDWIVNSEEGDTKTFNFKTPHFDFDTVSITYSAGNISTLSSYYIDNVKIEEVDGVTVLAENGKSFLNSGKKQFKVGEQYQLSTLLSADNIGQDIEWATSDETVATVTDGLVNFIGSGKVEITATVNGESDYANFVVYNADGSYKVTSNNVNLVYEPTNPANFVLDLAANKGLKVLQLSDPQIIDVTQQRYAGRLSEGLAKVWADRDKAVYDTARKVIEEVDPDLILIAGDVIYGEFDDNGSMMTEFVEFMEEQEIFWAPVFGNHDNESNMGTAWQCRQFETATYCLFDRGTTTGNGNYIISVKQDGEYIRNIYMLDTNACSASNNANDNVPVGIYASQRATLTNFANEFKSMNGGQLPNGWVCMHIPPKSSYESLANYGYTYNDSADQVIDLTEETDGSFGTARFSANHTQNAMFASDFTFNNELKNFATSMSLGTLDDLFASLSVKDVSFGHKHSCNTSAVYNGIRYTYGLKTGIMPDYTVGETGGTVFTLTANGFEVEHHYDGFAPAEIKGFTNVTNLGTNIISADNSSVEIHTDGEQTITTSYKYEAGKTYRYSIKTTLSAANGSMFFYDNLRGLEGKVNITAGTKLDDLVFEHTCTFTATSNGTLILYAYEWQSPVLTFSDLTFEEVLPPVGFVSVTRADNVVVDCDGSTAVVNTGDRTNIKTSYTFEAGKTYRYSFKATLNVTTTENLWYKDNGGSTAEIGQGAKITSGTKLDGDGLIYQHEYSFTATANGTLEMTVAQWVSGMSITFSDLTFAEVTE